MTRELRIREARKDFYSFCCLLHPDFYNEDHLHLKELCDTLQKLVEGKLKFKEKGKTYTYKRLIMELPPRHGKSHTLTMFEAWRFGKNPKHSAICTSYNDDLAQEFSMYVRNTISEEKNVETQIVYSDIFPDTKIKHGDSSYKKWSLEGSHFSYKGSGTKGTITGKGAIDLLVDDPVKNEEEAFNENVLEKKWNWFTGTLLSRQEKGKGKESAIIIVNHTAWAKNDIGGILQRENHKSHPSKRYFVYSKPAFDGKKMLCPAILDKLDYDDLKVRMPKMIFEANYNNKRINAEGLLYGENFKTYDKLPVVEMGNEVYEEKVLFSDTADTGQDFLVAFSAKIYKGHAYIFDAYYTQESVEVTEDELAWRLIDNCINKARIEGNNAGHAIAHHVKRILDEKYNWQGTIFDTFTQSKNKETRILSLSGQVKERVIFPDDWKTRWPEIYDAVTEFKRKFKDNKHDDIPDTLTQIVEYMSGSHSKGGFFGRVKGL